MASSCAWVSFWDFTIAFRTSSSVAWLAVVDVDMLVVSDSEVWVDVVDAVGEGALCAAAEDGLVLVGVWITAKVASEATNAGISVRAIGVSRGLGVMGLAAVGGLSGFSDGPATVRRASEVASSEVESGGDGGVGSCSGVGTRGAGIGLSTSSSSKGKVSEIEFSGVAFGQGWFLHLYQLVCVGFLWFQNKEVLGSTPEAVSAIKDLDLMSRSAERLSETAEAESGGSKLGEEQRARLRQR
ncbi:hypothetical protein PM082_020104 [Marasmius tenuissimus]|nr:hypothetical protein PM082_020104 [Marasmius tenuissimus]